jgi:YVTN family beta-propeller protein
LCLFVLAPWLLANSGVASGGEQGGGKTAYSNFEGPQVHPLALTPDRRRLLALNTPNNQLLVYKLDGDKPSLVAEVPVGLEPVSVAVRNEREAWVVNWVSDSVSVVDLNEYRVVRSFDVGDEPTDIVFAGRAPERAYVCVSGLSQVKVYDPDAPRAEPLVLQVRGKQPRSLARDAAGARVFVSIFESGNGTTVVPRELVADGGGLPPSRPPMALGLPLAPVTGLIVKWDGSRWADERASVSWNSQIKFRPADVDVVVIDAASRTPSVSQEVRQVGTLVGNAAFDAAGGRLLVANIESLNHIRFEPNLKGRFTRTRLAAVSFDRGGARVMNLDLNPHIDYGGMGSDGERALSLALPADVQVAADGTAYIAANGSAKVGVIDPRGAVVGRIAVGQGPTGLALDEARARLYVLNRFEETLSVVDTKAGRELGRVPLGYNPEPPEVREGRRFLYDASLSMHGDIACASCHANAQRDGLAWDVGNPLGRIVTVRATSKFVFHPMKGPMTTQSLRGVAGAEPMHWRGDRPRLEDFNPAFVSLMGSPRQLTEAEMNQFKAFVASLTYPPNPRQNLDRTYDDPASGPSAVRGERVFKEVITHQKTLTCAGCHTPPPGNGSNRDIIPADTRLEAQSFKVPQLRGLYHKVGRANVPGEQVTGYGFTHDGTEDSVFSFLRRHIFQMTDEQRRDVEEFVLSFDTGTAPAVGLQVTVNGENKSSPRVAERIRLLVAQADAGNCDLIVNGIYGRAPRGFFYVGNNRFKPDRQGEPYVTWESLVAAAGAGGELTFMGVMPGTGMRLGIDEDGDGVLNADEAVSRGGGHWTTPLTTSAKK